MKGFGNLMKEAQKLQAQMEAMREEIAKKKVEATAGGGMVTVEASGNQEIVSIKIDPEVINPNDAQMLEDLVLAAVNGRTAQIRDFRGIPDAVAATTAIATEPGAGEG